MPVRALACFPPYATLKEVCFSGSSVQANRLDDMLGEAIQLCKHKLVGVEKVTLQVSDDGIGLVVIFEPNCLDDTLGEELCKSLLVWRRSRFR